MAGDLRAVRLAGIDIGTNTVLLLVAEVGGPAQVTPLAEEQEIPRLGRDVDASGRIRETAFPGLARIVSRYRGIAASHGVSRIAACATSAFRNAANREDIIRYVRDAAGVGIEVIDGAEEAELTFRGALSRSAGATGTPAFTPGDTAVLDIGGGSTEICYTRHDAAGDGGKPARISMEIGSVRLTERFFRHSPPEPAEIDRARKAVEEAFAGITDPGFEGHALVAVAGTAVTLAGFHLGLRVFDREKIDGCTIGARVVREMAERLLSMTPAEVRLLSDFTAGREDILAAGALILSVFAEYFGFNEIHVSTRGLRHGIVLREWGRMRDTASDAGH